MDKEKFLNFLKIREIYKLKNVTRGTSNKYNCEKENRKIERKETTAEHIYSSLKLADFFFENEEEFKNLDRLKVYELLMYHDDIEIEVGDVPISDTKARKTKEKEEVEGIFSLASKYPEKIKNKFIKLDEEFREQKTSESKFALAIDKLDAMIHELSYPEDWGEKTGFIEKNLREWHKGKFEHSKTFTEYFEELMNYLNQNKYFEN